MLRRRNNLTYLAEKARCSHEVRNQAAEVSLRAERRAGEVTREIEYGKDGPRPKKLVHLVPVSKNATLEQAGISKPEASRWERIASLPEEILPTSGKSNPSSFCVFVPTRHPNCSLPICAKRLYQKCCCCFYSGGRSGGRISTPESIALMDTMRRPRPSSVSSSSYVTSSGVLSR